MYLILLYSSFFLYLPIYNVHYHSNGTGNVDFGLDQVDVKRKIKAKLGPNVIIRLNLTPTAYEGDQAGSPTAGHGATKGQYEMVPLAGGNGRDSTDGGSATLSGESSAGNGDGSEDRMINTNDDSKNSV